jgi:putative aldouronate transport system substrate-binding protein
MSKKILNMFSIVIALVLVVCMFSGCSKTASNDTASVASKQSSEDISSIKDSNIPTINVVIPVMGTTTESSGNVEEKINEILSKKVGANIKITWTSFGEHNQQVNMMLTNSDELDISYLSGSPLGYISNGQLLNLSDYLSTDEGKEIAKVVGQTYIDAAKINGKSYYIPTVSDRARENYFLVNRALAEETGEDLSDERIWTLDEIHDLILKVKEAHPDIYGLVGVNPDLDGDNLCDTYNIGIVPNNGNADKVVSITDLDSFKSLVQTMYEWNQEGIMMPDILNNSADTYSMIINGQAFGDFRAGACPNGMESSESKRALLSVNNQWISSEAAARMYYIINANTKYPEIAFKVLTEMYTDEEIKELLCFGIKDVNWTLDSEGRAAYPNGVTADTATYNVGFNNWWVFANGQCDMVPYTNVKDYWERSRNYDEEASISGSMGCIFNSEKVQGEYSECINVYSQYYKALLCGQMEPNSGISQYSTALKEAGEEKVIEEKQTQLDAVRSTK